MSTENLHNDEARKKLKELVDKIDVGILCTYPPDQPYVHAVPMSRQEADEEGNIWYLFSSESDTFTHLQQNNKVSILFSQVSDYSFLSLNGVASVSQDKARIEKYWNKFVEAWFEKGKEDPRIRVMKVRVDDAHYWDNKTSKLVTFLKVAVSAVTGKKLDTGREGELNV